MLKADVATLKGQVGKLQKAVHVLELERTKQQKFNAQVQKDVKKVKKMTAGITLNNNSIIKATGKRFDTVEANAAKLDERISANEKAVEVRIGSLEGEVEKQGKGMRMAGKVLALAVDELNLSPGKHEMATADLGCFLGALGGSLSPAISDPNSYLRSESDSMDKSPPKTPPKLPTLDSTSPRKSLISTPAWLLSLIHI